MEDKNNNGKYIINNFSAEKILEGFLETEIQSAGLYRGIIDFIESCEIRNGEFECNEYIIKKLDRNNFLLYPEYGDGVHVDIQVPYAAAIYKNELIKAVNDRARLNGII